MGQAEMAEYLEEMAERERLAKLVLEELAREAAADGPAQCD